MENELIKSNARHSTASIVSDPDKTIFGWRRSSWWWWWCQTKRHLSLFVIDAAKTMGDVLIILRNEQYLETISNSGSLGVSKYAINCRRIFSTMNMRSAFVKLIEMALFVVVAEQVKFGYILRSNHEETAAPTSSTGLNHNLLALKQRQNGKWCL